MTTVDELMVRLFHAPRILVVQDCAASVDVVLHRSFDCTVDVTTDGKAAAAKLATNKYDLILVDLVLLNGTSEQVLKAAEAFQPEVPVVATSIDEHTLEHVVAEGSTLTILSSPVTDMVIQRLFRVFKIKAKTHEMAAYCADLVRPPSLPSQAIVAQAG